MNKSLVCLLLILIPAFLKAQDTIFVRSGEIIPAVIVSKDNTEIKYKKFGQPEPAAVYSVFVTDVKSIHYSDGIVADYTAAPGSTGKGKSRPIADGGKIGTGKISLGISAAYWKYKVPADLVEFWQKNPFFANNTPIAYNPVYYPLEFRTSFVMGTLKRSWIGTGLELIFTPQDAITAKSSDGSDAINLKAWYYNIPLYYGHTINHKKNLVAIFEPALNLSFVSGSIILNNKEYKLVSNLGSGMSLSAGIDWIITKRLHTSLRVGQRLLKQKESHKDPESSTGFTQFYVNPSVNEDLLTIRWDGPFVSAGICWSGYFRMKGFRPE